MIESSLILKQVVSILLEAATSNAHTLHLQASHYAHANNSFPSSDF